MFKLPIKEIVINSSSVVNAYAAADVSHATPLAATAVVEGDTVVIDGFGQFLVPALVEDAADPAFGFITPAVDAVAGVFDITPPATVAIGEVWDLRLTFTQGPRVLSEIWSYGEKRTFQGGAIAAATAAGWVDAFVAAQTVNPEYFGEEQVLEFSNVADKLRVTFKPGYEGLGIRLARTVEANDTTGLDTTLVIATVAEPSEGVNLGKQIEAEVRNATFDNIDPYGIQLGGNAQGVDVRGKYTEIHWTSVAPMNGFEPHSMTGYGDANTETNHAPTEQSAYCNEVSVSADVIAILSKLTGFVDEVA